MDDAGIVIVLDGPRCVGRSTTLAGLQRAWPEVRSGPLLEAGLDAALAAFGPGSRRWHELVLPTGHDPTDGYGEGRHRIGWGPLGRELIVGMHRAAAAWARSGFDVAIDHVVFDRLTAQDLAQAMDGLPLVHVGMVCDEDVLEDRERALGEGRYGAAAAQLRATRELVRRDLVLDTTEATTAELVDVILAEVARRS